MEVMLEIVVLIMEVDKVVDEVTDMEIDKQTDDMVVNITNEEFFGVTLTIFDKYGDYVRSNYVGAGHGGSQGGKISN